MYGRQYQWLIPGWFKERWWEEKNNTLECTPAQIKLAAGNYIAIMESTWSSDPRETINGQVDHTKIRELENYNSYYNYSPNVQ
jgi:hypothetical protein